MKTTTDFFAGRLLLTLLAVLTTTFAWAQQLSGEGTKANPYLINSSEDWATFTTKINTGTNDDRHAFYKLTADLTLGDAVNPYTTVVGKDKQHPFSGSFDGDFHIIHLYLVRENDYAALFGVTDGATIQNLHVDGTIITDHKFAGGFIGYAFGAGTGTQHWLANCISSVNIHCDGIKEYIDINGNVVPNGSNNRRYDCTHGGLVGQNEKGVMNFYQCIFDGSITDSKEVKTANKCTGFIGWVNNKVVYYDCIMAGYIDVKPNDDNLKNSMANFHRTGDEKNVKYEGNVFYVHDYSYDEVMEQGDQAPSVVPEGVISRQLSFDNQYYYATGAELINDNKIKFYGWTYQTDNNNIVGGADGINYVYDNSDDTYTTTFVERYDLQNDGMWNDAANWKYGLIPSGGDVMISANVTIPEDCNAKVNDIIVSSKGSVTIMDGAQFISDNSIVADVYKTVLPSDEVSKHAWNTIASPINGQAFAAVDELTSGEKHNIYRYNETVPMWEEYRDPSNEFNAFENGRGYIYRTTFGGDIKYSGSINAEDVKCSLTRTNDHGFNLLGNPYTHNIYKGVAFSSTDLVEGYCVLESDGTWDYKNDDEAIPSGTAFMVLVKEGNDDVDINMSNTDEAPVVYCKSNDNSIWFTVNNDEYTDAACIKFNEGEGFKKLAHYNESAPMLYINYNGGNFAAAHVQTGVKAVGLCFKSHEFGKYTLNLNANGDFSYLHLIDRLTGKDVDMLIEDEYSFISTNNDNAERFIVEFDYEGNEGGVENENFAWQNDSDIVINGEGKLQVFDMMGRIVMTQDINGIQTMSTSSLQEGVYIFKLNGKTQKFFVK